MTSSTRKPKRSQKSAHSAPAPRNNDRGVYVAFVLVGLFIAFLAFLMFAENWRPIVLGYCAAIGVLIHIYAFAAYRGGQLAGWKQSLARVALRPAGFGRKGGKPLEAAHNAPEAIKAITISLVITVIIIAALTFLLIPQARFWG